VASSARGLERPGLPLATIPWEEERHVAKHRPRARRQARRQQHQRSVAEARRAERRRYEATAAALEARLAELTDAALDLDRNPDQVADLAVELLHDPLVGRLLGRSAFGFQTGSELLAADESEEGTAPADPLIEARRAALAEAFASAAKADPGLVWLAAGTFEGAGETARAEALVAQAVDDGLTSDTEPGGRMLLASLRLTLGRYAEALEVLDEAWRRAPEVEELQLLSALALGLAVRITRAPADEPCPCRSTRSLEACCGPGLEARLDRFRATDRLERLGEAMAQWVRADPDRSQALDAAISDFFDQLARAADDAGQPLGAVDVARTTERYGNLALERAWLVAGLDDEDDESGLDDDGNTLLGRFAADPSSGAELATDAAAWVEKAEYGLWQVADPRSEPGVWLVDIATGRRRYASLSGARLDHLARWSVLLGPVVPIDDAWRATSGIVVLDPIEGDALARVVDDLADQVARAIAEEEHIAHPKRSRRSSNFDLSPGVLVDLVDAADTASALGTSRVVAAALGELVGYVEAGRRRRAMSQEDSLEWYERELISAKREAWLDEKSSVLGGLTPRRAAEDPRGRIRLEALLRNLEHVADRAGARGDEPLDVSTLRAALQMDHGV